MIFLVYTCSSNSVILHRAVKNNSIKLMIVGMHQKGKTTLLRHLSSIGGYEDSGCHQPPEEPNAKTVGIKLGLWKYSRSRGNPTNEHPIIEFYAWDYAGDVCCRKIICMYIVAQKVLAWKMSLCRTILLVCNCCV